MATLNDIQNRLACIARDNNIPLEWFQVGGSYGNTTLELRYIDWKTGELTTGVTRLYTGTKNGLYDALGLMWTIRYEADENKQRRKDARKARKTASLTERTLNERINDQT